MQSLSGISKCDKTSLKRSLLQSPTIILTLSWRRSLSYGNNNEQNIQMTLRKRTDSWFQKEKKFSFQKEGKSNFFCSKLFLANISFMFCILNNLLMDSLIGIIKEFLYAFSQCSHFLKQPPEVFYKEGCS